VPTYVARHRPISTSAGKFSSVARFGKDLGFDHVVVEPVAQRSRQDGKRFRRAPRPAERGHGRDETVELGEGDAVDDGKAAVVIVGRQAVPAKKRLAERRLRRGEAEAFSRSSLGMSWTKPEQNTQMPSKTISAWRAS
jgi:hypothetical protein